MENKAYIYGIIAVFLWSTVASAFKISLKYLNFLQLLFYSSIFSILILFSILIFQNKLSMLKYYSRRDYFYSIFLGFLNPFLYYIVLFKAYSLLPAQQAQPLNYTWPIMLVLFSILLLKRKIKWMSIIALIISFVGVFIISTEGNFLIKSNLEGIFLALSSSIIWALFWIYNMKDNRDVVTKLFLNFLFGFIFISIFMVISSKIIFSIYGIIGALYVGLFEMGITFIVWLKALELSKNVAKISNLIYFSPFISLIFIHLIVGEKILPQTILGLILIVGGIIMQRYSG